MSNRVFISGLHRVRRENRATRLVLERCSDEEFGKQVVTVTTSRGSEKMELLLSTVVQACSPPQPGRAARHPVSRQYGSPPTPSGPVLHREPRCRLSTAARPSFRSISRRINTPPFDDSFPPSNVAVIVFPPTGDKPGRNSVASVMVSGDSCWSRTVLFRQQNHT